MDYKKASKLYIYHFFLSLLIFEIFEYVFQPLLWGLFSPPNMFCGDIKNTCLTFFSFLHAYQVSLKSKCLCRVVFLVRSRRTYTSTVLTLIKYLIIAFVITVQVHFLQLVLRVFTFHLTTLLLNITNVLVYFHFTFSFSLSFFLPRS